MKLALTPLPAVTLPPNCPPQVKKAVEVLRSSAVPLISNALARRAACSKFHLSRLFVTHLGMPPSRLHRALRVRRGAELLLLGHNPCDVALALGFSDQAHFTRHFRRLFGLPPRRYVRCHDVAA